MLNFTNYSDHPADNRYIVFHFYDKKKATHFENLIKTSEITYETDFVPGDDIKKDKFLFGIHKRFKSKAMRANHMTEAIYRKKFMPYSFLRWSVLILTLLAITLGILGYIKTH